jgi:hypothetical protein
MVGLIIKNIKMKNRLRNGQFKYLDYLFENTCVIRYIEYPNSTFLKKDNKVVMELRDYGALWVKPTIWNNISDMFSLDYDETQQLIKDWAEQHLELEGITPAIDQF